MKAKCIHPGPWHTRGNPPPQGWPKEGTEYDVECVVFDEQGVWLKLTAWPGDDYFAAKRFDIAPAQAADATEEFPTIIIAVANTPHGRARRNAPVRLTTAQGGITMQWMLYRTCGVIWLGPWCFSYTSEAPLFSERNGYRKPFAKLGHLRLFLERRTDLRR